jgi:hypothetical protein
VTGTSYYFICNNDSKTVSWNGGSGNSGQCYLQILVPNGFKLDDLLFNPAVNDPTYIEHKTHAVIEQKWSATLDYEKDLIIVPKTGGKVWHGNDIALSTSGIVSAAGDRGYLWHNIINPTTDYMWSKTSGWSSDTWVTIDALSLYPALTPGTKAIKVFVKHTVDGGPVYWRKYGDTNIATNPDAGKEYSHLIGANTTANQAEIWLSDDYKFQIAHKPGGGGCSFYISFPFAELR